MTGHRHVMIAAAGATFLAATPLAAVFRTYSWTFYTAGAVAAVLVVALLTHHLRLAAWAQTASMAGAHIALLTWLFGDGTGFVGVIPTFATLGRFGVLLSMAGADVRTLAAPVPDTDGLLFTVAASIGVVAILTQLLATRWRRPAVAGLPMLAIYSVPVAVLADSVSWFAFGLAAAGFLWLLVADHVSQVRGWGRRFADDGRDVDAWEGSPLAATGRRLGFVGITAAVLIPLAVPGVTAGFLDWMAIGTGNGVGSGPGVGSSLDPFANLQGNLRRSRPFDVLRITTNDPAPGYLRLAVADRITDEGARPGPKNSDRFVMGGWLSPRPVVPQGAEEWRSKVQVAAPQREYLPIYPDTTRIRIEDDNRWRYDNVTDVTWAPRRTLARGTTYTLTYQKYEYKGEELQDADPPDLKDEALRQFTDVPDSPTVNKLVNQLIDGQDTQYDRVMAILEHFSEESGFRYDLDTTGVGVEDFLKNRRGYCQQYAVAMAWMLRVAKIPARVVIGYTQGRKTDYGFLVQSRNAHAWVEVYFTGYGWVPFDPTPPTGVEDEVRMGWAPNPYRPEQSSSTAGPTANPSIATSPSAQRPDRQDAGEGVVASPGQDPQRPDRWPYWLLSGLALAAVAAGPGLSRWRRRRRRLALAAAPGDPAAGAHAAWEELLDTLVDLDIGYQQSDTPRGLARRLRDVRPPLIESSAVELKLLARGEERARYAPQPLSNSELEPAVRAVTAELHAVSSRWVRFRAAALPSSVIQDWRRSATVLRDRVLDGWHRWRRRIPGQASTRQGST